MNHGAGSQELHHRAGWYEVCRIPLQEGSDRTVSNVVQRSLTLIRLDARSFAAHFD